MYNDIEYTDKKWKEIIQVRLRNVTGSREVIAESCFVVQEPIAHRGKWGALFGNQNRVNY